METTMTMKRCSGCKQEKPRTEFGKDQSRKDGLNYRCRECDRAHDGGIRQGRYAREEAQGGR